ncbi:MAG: MBL fold metallo-hydrolase [Deltaproteobacteria bacterium]|nr:MBL fold metallo-hydrolase [Deltaproteobacteria bacterium]
MHIKCWGSRGGLPACGKRFIKYGGDTTCLEVRGDSGEVIVIDAGSGIRELGARLAEEGVSHITLLFTHAHWDHIYGFPFFAPLFSEDVTIDIYGAVGAEKTYEKILSRAMADPFFPVQLDAPDFKAALRFKELKPEILALGGVDVEFIMQSHPKDGSLGYSFTEKGGKFVFMTDNELGFTHKGASSRDQFVRFVQGAELLVHDAEYTPSEYALFRTRGHSSYEQAIDLAVDGRVKRLGLFHIKAGRTDHEVDRIEAEAVSYAREKGMAGDCFVVPCGAFFKL